MRATIIIFTAFILSGCATTFDSKYKPSVGTPVSMARLVANTNSTGTTGRFYNLFLSESNTCASGPMVPLGAQLLAEAHQTLPSAAIPAGRPITLVVQYREARAGQTKACGNVAKFTPEAGHNYDIQFNVTNQGASCAISVLDAASGLIALEPSDTCYAQLGAPNGTALATNYEVRVQSYP
jgi:hypothetical protein